ncbi:unnamed protein product [Polarella glacialis]|uniref:RRM domain-containing protein n=1 Tax=Polarella glacialis TaxID=89957 RepID=A0A813KE46_POLGL|nr:unnamed protein product [Polarella glacialis]
MALSRGAHAGLWRRRPRGTLLLRGCLLAAALSCLHLFGTDFVAGFPLPQTARGSLHKAAEPSSQTSEGTEAEETRIFIGGFDLGTTEAAIREHFAKAGSVVEFKARGKVKAELAYGSAAEAKKAVASLNGTTVAGNSRVLSVRMYKSIVKIGPAIFVSGFADGTAEPALREHFGTAGSIVNFTFLGNYSALVTYSSNEEGTSAVASLHGKSMDGSNRLLDVRVEGTAKVAILKENTVSIIGWDKGTTVAAIQEHCGKAGSILDLQVIRGLALLTFSSSEEAATAVASLDNTTIEGNSRFIRVRDYEGPRR